MSEEIGASGPARRSRWRGVTSWVLVVVGCLLAVLAVVADYARAELLDTDTYVATVTPLATNPAIQTQVAKVVSARLVARSDLERRIKAVLPARADFLATPASQGVQAAVDRAVLAVVRSERFTQLWVAANRTAHGQVVELLTGSGGALALHDDRITLDLSAVVADVKQRLDAEGITFLDRVDVATGAELTLFQSNTLTHVQGPVRLLNDLVVVLPIVAVVLLFGAVALARDHRRGLVRAAGGLALAMVIVLVALALVRNQYLSSLGPSQSRPANEAVLDAFSASLVATTRWVLLASALVAIGGALVGVPALRRWAASRQTPSWLAEGPFHDAVTNHRRGWLWAAVGIGAIVLVAWNDPTVVVAVVCAAVVLAVVGTIGLISRTSTSASTSTAGHRPSGPDPDNSGAP